MLDSLDIEVHSIIINNDVQYDYVGSLYNLGTADNNRSTFFKKIKKGFLLYHYLKENQINCIIDNRPRNNLLREIFANMIYGSRKKIVVVHSYKLENYFPRSVFWSRFLYKKAHTIIAVSAAIEEEIQLKFKFENTATIYNPFKIAPINTASKDFSSQEYLLYFGRLDDTVKNFKLMIEAFYISKLFLKGLKLILLGNGPDEEHIHFLINELNMEEFVMIVPFTPKPFEIVSQAKFTVLTSRYEGFPLSIVESLAVGTPVVAVDCESGPSEIIIDQHNGLLVENNNVDKLAAAFNRMISDKNLYTNCKNNARQSVAHLSLETISKQWETILC
jgi:glycosyltransferase involved in cell wall biosynthesis